jgi:hypothetical protein
MVTAVAAFQGAHYDAFERAQLTGHITASARIVDETDRGRQGRDQVDAAVVPLGQ